MMFSLRTALRSLSVLALTAAFLPGCDSEEYEALGLSVEQLDEMSAEELDELAALESEVDRDIGIPTPPVQPDPLYVPVRFAAHSGTDTVDLGGPTQLANPVRPTHDVGPTALANPVRPTHEMVPPVFTMPVPPPTHDSPADNVFDLSDAEEIGGCDTIGGDYPEISNG